MIVPAISNYQKFQKLCKMTPFGNMAGKYPYMAKALGRCRHWLHITYGQFTHRIHTKLFMGKVASKWDWNGLKACNDSLMVRSARKPPTIPEKLKFKTLSARQNVGHDEQNSFPILGRYLQVSVFAGRKYQFC